LAEIERIEVQLSVARQQRRAGSAGDAVKMLVSIIESGAPMELKRQAILELAFLAQDRNQLSRAQQIYAQYLHLFPQHPSVPEVYLRQGLLYRRMGVPGMAIAKFYAVMTSSLTLKLDKLDYYQRLVLQAQTEIAETYFSEGRFREAAEFFGRLLRLQAPDLDKAQIHFKYIYALARLERWPETAGQAEQYLLLYPGTLEEPEVRFMFASALKRLGRNADSTRQVLELLQAQEAIAAETPDQWIYWRQRAGNEIANELYQEGDYISALEIYLTLAELDATAAWQIPVWYQTGLVYERLRQSQRAVDIYTRIVDRAATVPNLSPALQAVAEMAKWRKNHVAWIEQAKTASLSIHPNSVTNPPVRTE
jgi:tetratricopeptide (TPR) repeat protein